MMSETKDFVVEEEVDDSIDGDERVDENSRNGFKFMGYKHRLSDNMLMVFEAFKSKKDALRPGPLSPEAMATVAIIGDMFDGKLKPVE